MKSINNPPIQRRNKTSDPNVLATQLADISYNVKTFGAKLDGITDDSDAINATIEAVHNKGGGKVLISGITLITKPLKLYSNVTIKGNGIDKTVIYVKFLSSYVNNNPAYKHTLQKMTDRKSAFQIVGTNLDDDFDTYYYSTGDYYTVSPRPFAVNTEIKQNANTIPLVNIGNLAVGDYIAITEGMIIPHPAKSEMAKIKSISGNTITLDRKLINGYSNKSDSIGYFTNKVGFNRWKTNISDRYVAGLNDWMVQTNYPSFMTWEIAGIYKIDPIMNVRIEDLTIDSTNSEVDITGIYAHVAKNIYVNNVKLVNCTYYATDTQDVFIDGIQSFSDANKYFYFSNGGMNINITNSIFRNCTPYFEEGSQYCRFSKNDVSSEFSTSTFFIQGMSRYVTIDDCNIRIPFEIKDSTFKIKNTTMITDSKCILLGTNNITTISDDGLTTYDALTNVNTRQFFSHENSEITGNTLSAIVEANTIMIQYSKSPFVSDNKINGAIYLTNNGTYLGDNFTKLSTGFKNDKVFRKTFYINANGTTYDSNLTYISPGIYEITYKFLGLPDSWNTMNNYFKNAFLVTTGSTTVSTITMAGITNTLTAFRIAIQENTAIANPTKRVQITIEYTMGNI